MTGDPSSRAGRHSVDAIGVHIDSHRATGTGDQPVPAEWADLYTPEMWQQSLKRLAAVRKARAADPGITQRYVEALYDAVVEERAEKEQRDGDTGDG